MEEVIGENTVLECRLGRLGKSGKSGEFKVQKKKKKIGDVFKKYR